MAREADISPAQAGLRRGLEALNKLLRADAKPAKAPPTFDPDYNGKEEKREADKPAQP